MHNQNPFKIMGLGAIIIILILKVSLTEVMAQDNQSARPQSDAPARYNFEELAVNLTLRVGKEASSLTSPAEKIEIQLEAAGILSQSHKDDALRLLDLAWNTLKEWDREEKTASLQPRPQLRARLRSDILALYSKLDPERAGNLVKSQPTNSPESAEANKEASGKDSFITAERQRADDLAKIGLIQIERNPSEGIGTAISSLLQTGEVSESLSLISQTLKEKGKESLLKDFESRLAGILVHRASLNPFDLRAVVRIINADPQMQGATRSSLLKFLSNSLAKLNETIKDAQNGKRPLSIDIDTVGSVYSIYVRNVRSLISSYEPNSANGLNLLIDEIASVLPASWLDRVYETSTTDPPEQQLERARNTKESELRDSRLARFALRALNGALPGMKGRQPEWASRAVDIISASETKTILQDYILMVNVERLSKESNYALAAEKASAISKSDWRAWSLMALASAQAEQNWSRAMQLCEDAFRSLEKSSPTPRKVELAFALADLWSRRDLNQALDITDLAVKYANQVVDTGSRMPEIPSDLQAFFLNIGRFNFAPGIEPQSLNEIGFDEGIGRLALTHWMRADQIGDTIQNVGLRLRFQLAICRGVLITPKVDKKMALAN